MANIRAYDIATGLEKSGYAFADIDPGAAGVQAAVGSIAVFDIAVDDAAWECAGPYFIPGIPHIVMSLDGETAGAIGEGITMPDVSATPRRLWLKSYTADPTSAVLVLPQPMLTPVTGATPIGSGIDRGLGIDTGSLTKVIRLGAGTDRGLGIDMGSLVAVGGPIALGTGTDRGLGVDSGILYAVRLLGTGMDAGLGVDAGSLAFFLVAPTLTSLAATDGGFTVSVGAVTGATDYDLQHTLNTDTDWASATIVHNVGAGSESVSGLTNGSLYKVRARTVNATGDGPWGASQTVTPASSGTTYYFPSGGGALGTSLAADPSWVGDFPAAIVVVGAIHAGDSVSHAYLDDHSSVINIGAGSLDVVYDHAFSFTTPATGNIDRIVVTSDSGYGQGFAFTKPGGGYFPNNKAVTGVLCVQYWQDEDESGFFSIVSHVGAHHSYLTIAD